MAMVVCMCLGVSSCTHRNREIEEIAQRELGYYKDFYVIALQTGRVKLPNERWTESSRYASGNGRR